MNYIENIKKALKKELEKSEGKNLRKDNEEDFLNFFALLTLTVGEKCSNKDIYNLLNILLINIGNENYELDAKNIDKDKFYSKKRDAVIKAARESTEIDNSKDEDLLKSFAGLVKTSKEWVGTKDQWETYDNCMNEEVLTDDSRPFFWDENEEKSFKQYLD